MANRLGAATSPYLLQHAHNPVDWWPWSDEAFAEARRRGVPVFLSVGYAACHWCHVMAHESFEDERTAALLNERFVAVKVDREERPDVDAVYMQATQAMTGQGGWPMSVFLTPDRRPFYAGTYFPPTSRHGLPSFNAVLDAVSEAWQGRLDDVLASAAQIAEQLSAAASGHAPGRVSEADCTAAVEQLGTEFDPANGGFGRAPKFPPSMVLEALLREGGEAAMAMAGQTLLAMARGGIYDQLVGGFARYSVDARWQVPHFEKMLYDNALLLGVYAHWWRLTGEPLGERVVGETVDWLMAEMRTREGAFAASLDADSLDDEGRLREGAYYAWDRSQLELALGADDADWAAAVFSVTAAGTFEEGRSTLQLPVDADDPTRFARIRRRLAEVRAGRPAPGRDDKVVAAWNGWLIDSLTQTGLVLDRPDWLAAARDAATCLWEVHWRDGRLRRASRDGVAGDAPAILEDYAALAAAYVRLAAAYADPAWLDRARALLDVVGTAFDDGRGGFFDTAADAERLYLRPQDPTDNATPSGLSSAVNAMRLFAELTGEQHFADRAQQAALTAGGLVTAAPRFAGWLLADVLSQTPGRRPVQVAVVGPEGAQRGELVRLAHRLAPAGSVVVAGVPDQPGLALLAGRPLIDGRPTAYVCRGFVCRLPVTSASALAEQFGP